MARTKKFQIVFSQREYDCLVRQAREREISVAEFLRDWVKALIQEEESKTKNLQNSPSIFTLQSISTQKQTSAEINTHPDAVTAETAFAIAQQRGCSQPSLNAFKQNFFYKGSTHWGIYKLPPPARNKYLVFDYPPKIEETLKT